MDGVRNLLLVSAILVVIKTEFCTVNHDCRYENCTDRYQKRCEKGQCTCSPFSYQNCDALKVMTGLAHNLPAGNGLTKCPDNQHIPVIYFIFDACQDIPSLLANWSKDQKVKDICNTLPHYTAIARFNDTTRVDFTTTHAGVFIGCEKDYFKMVTEDCHTNLQVLHISLKDPDADNFYVIKQIR